MYSLGGKVQTGMSNEKLEEKMKNLQNCDRICRFSPTMAILKQEMESGVRFTSTGCFWKLIFLNVLLLGIKSLLRAVIISKILLIGFHFDISCEKVSNIMLEFLPLQFNYNLNI